MIKIAQQQRRILIIDDNPSIHDDYRKILATQTEDDDSELLAFFEDEAKPVQKPQPLGGGILISSAYQGEEGVNMIAEAIAHQQPYSMAFVDMRMPPGWNGLKTIQEIWRIDPEIQVVICTAYADHSWEEILQTLGRSDSLLILKKPFDHIEVTQLAVALTEKWDLAQQARLTQAQLEQLVNERTEQLRDAALHDPLTNLANRKKFNDALEQAFARVRRDGVYVGLILIDVDYFKRINDTKGHGIGDQLLIQVSQRLRQCVRETDTVARLGGDEFAIIAVGLETPESASSLLKRIHQVLSQPYLLNECQMDCGFSMGLALAPTDSMDGEDLLNKADIALYQSKEEGRGCFHCFNKEVETKILQRRKIETKLLEGIQNQEFEVYYQPILDIDSNKIAVMEALVRWQHPTEGFMSPLEFISIAEETRLIVPLGEWIMRKACTDAVHWPTPIKVALNISSIQIENSEFFLAQVDSILEETGLPPERLELEITESVLMKDDSATLELLMSLQGKGIGIVLDDFGTGYSSLSYLQRFKFDKLKLDRSFVLGLPGSEESRAILQVVGQLGQSFCMVTTAEGVEEQSQLEYVKTAGFTQTQGYFHSKPLPAADAQ
ncbi:MAG: EAL domain-containing protein [Acaryochloridaceae cyanobacterium RL_2_7]|nr:EAL domain-containing protein [Acaryochloridaceae cyanobacterium RL_2_7]